MLCTPSPVLVIQYDLLPGGFRAVTPLYKPYPFTLSTGKTWHPGVPWGSLKKRVKIRELERTSQMRLKQKDVSTEN